MLKIGVQQFTVAMLKHCTPVHFRGNLFPIQHCAQLKKGFQPWPAAPRGAVGARAGMTFSFCKYQ